MKCSRCDAPATIMVRSEGMNERGIMVIVAWAGWEEIAGGAPAPESLFCAQDAGAFLSGLPQLAPTEHAPGSDGVTYTHG